MLLLNAYVKKILNPLLKQKNMHHSSIYTAWKEIVGEHIARFCWPKRVSFNAQTKSYCILHLEVTNSSFATELKYLESHLLEKIAVFFGYAAISQIKIKITLPPASAGMLMAEKKLQEKSINYLEQNLAPINDDSLKQALAALGAFVLP
jgi:hypothetical protein